MMCADRSGRGSRHSHHWTPPEHAAYRAVVGRGDQLCWAQCPYAERLRGRLDSITRTYSEAHLRTERRTSRRWPRSTLTTVSTLSTYVWHVEHAEHAEHVDPRHTTNTGQKRDLWRSRSVHSAQLFARSRKIVIPPPRTSSGTRFSGNNRGKIPQTAEVKTHFFNFLIWYFLIA